MTDGKTNMMVNLDNIKIISPSGAGTSIQFIGEENDRFSPESFSNVMTKLVSVEQNA